MDSALSAGRGPSDPSEKKDKSSRSDGRKRSRGGRSGGGGGGGERSGIEGRWQKGSAVDGGGGGDDDDGGTVLNIGNLNFDTKWPELKDHVKAHISTGFGKVDIGARADGRSTGRGTVAFRILADAEEAAAALDGTELDGRRISVKLAGGGRSRGGGGGGGGGASNFLRRDVGDKPRDGKRKRDEAPGSRKRGPKTAQDLDAEMDAYMSGTKEPEATADTTKEATKKTKKGPKTAEELDAEMDAYAAAAADNKKSEVEEEKPAEEAAEPEILADEPATEAA